ncbi:hypothetical protein IV203_032276 [Nitzschia inconspicua]|uniref:Uncharacterized protein n=1 Tax=Nitzschia inconspicua TaxID=303405 RepID=A0A9K3KKE6_9STRA|nr:hypothetical protein IV203_032276 [Nitzschia inconspicua]
MITLAIRTVNVCERSPQLPGRNSAAANTCDECIVADDCAPVLSCIKKECNRDNTCSYSDKCGANKECVLKPGQSGLAGECVSK